MTPSPTPTPIVAPSAVAPSVTSTRTPAPSSVPPESSTPRSTPAFATDAPLGPFELAVDELALSDEIVDLDDLLTATLTVSNEGGLPGTDIVEVFVDGAVVATEQVTLEGGERRELSFDLSVSEPGPHTVSAGDRTADMRVVDIRRPRSGKLVINKVGAGRGSLVVENQRDSDAFLVLTRDDERAKPVLGIYVHPGERHRIEGIRNGSYIIWDGSGQAWDLYSGRFTDEAQFSFDPEPLVFQSSSNSSHVWTITLYTGRGLPGGESVDADEFPDLAGEGDAE